MRQARAFLGAQGLERKVPAREFAAASAELGKGFRDTLRMVAVLQMAGQGQGPAPRAAALARKGVK